MIGYCGDDMISASIPPCETTRLHALYALEVLDSAPEAEFDALVLAASVVCRTPMAFLSLVDHDRQWFKAKIGLTDAQQTSREVAFCAHTILGEGVLEVPDATRDPRFRDNPLVVGAPDIRFYAGAPVRLSNGSTVGTLCVLDRRSRKLSNVQRDVLRHLADAAARALEGRFAMLRASRMSEDARFRDSHDALTGLGNRMQFDSRLEQSWASARAGSAEHSLLMIDVDHLKLINDTCGHAAGDLLLQQVAAILRDSMRDSDFIARLGGDEFAVILENCPLPAAHRIAQALCDRMEQFRFLHSGHRLCVGTSIGLVGMEARWSSAQAAVQAADDCCCAAKAAGGNRVRMWIDTDETIHARHSEMQCAAHIAEALDENRFSLYAQRIEPLGPHIGGLHAEVLLRMIDLDGSMISPGLFLPAAERFLMATRIDRWVLRRTIEWMLGVADLGHLERINVNLSGQSVGDLEFHRWAIALLAGSGERICRRLCLEITETAAVTHVLDAAAFVDQVRALGVQIALDDFGAGASSFGYLKTLKVDYLKIDGQFIRGLPDDRLDTATVRCFVDVARAMGIETVAEYVDRPVALECIREMGVDFAQGFLLHRPAPICELVSEVDMDPDDEPLAVAAPPQALRAP